jgi:hypothetical protein
VEQACGQVPDTDGVAHVLSLFVAVAGPDFASMAEPPAG